MSRLQYTQQLLTAVLIRANDVVDYVKALNQIVKESG